MTTPLDNLFRRINRHVILTEDEAVATTLWVAHTHCYNRFRMSPRLRLTSPERGCGKTTLLVVLNHTVRAALMTAHATPAAIFREISTRSPTLLFDEADASFRVEDMISILNTGHLRESAVVLRAGSTSGTQKFVTWAPAAFAVLDKIPDTLASRSITINLRRKGEDQTTKPLDDKAIHRLQKISRRIAKWCSINRKLLASAKPEVPDGFQNRDADNWFPLLAIAEVAGGDWPERARRAAKALQVKEQPAIGTELLTDCVSAWNKDPVLGVIGIQSGPRH